MGSEEGDILAGDRAEQALLRGDSDSSGLTLINLSLPRSGESGVPVTHQRCCASMRPAIAASIVGVAERACTAWASSITRRQKRRESSGVCGLACRGRRAA